MSIDIKQKLNGLFRKLIKFSGIGVINTAIDFLIYSLLYSVFHVDASFAHVSGYTIGTINSYFMNKYITYKGGTKDRRPEITRFIFTNALSLAISTLTIWLLTDIYYMNGYIAKLCAIIVTQGVNFTLYSFWVFRKK
jgi:putative flippase GtrA